ncbi:MAG TPA: alpha-amylase family glycosyl hydrolase [Rectinemataceae bacterium]|nr:alpha-amylase family glycosyl hydrolase [Rectinemataceae bacterium]
MIAVRTALVIRLEALEGPGPLTPRPGDRVMEFHVSLEARRRLGMDGSLFRSTGNLILPDFRAARLLARQINEKVDAAILPERAVRAGRLNAMALIDEILHDVARLFRERAEPEALPKLLAAMEAELGRERLDRLLLNFVELYPPQEVYAGTTTAAAWLAGNARAGSASTMAGSAAAGTAAAGRRVANRELAVEELLLLRLANENPAFEPFRFLFDETLLASPGSDLAADYEAAVKAMERGFAAMPAFGPDKQDLFTMLRSPAAVAPYSLPGQLDYIRSRWGLILGDILLRLLGALDLIREEEKPRFPGPGPSRAYVYSGMEHEYERFTEDRDWMPNVVMMAKSALVWLHQLSTWYEREIRTLDAIPDEELDTLATRGFNALWLIGLWERSRASAEIKRRCGNPEAAASAYSLFDYEIAEELGGWPALEKLREKCAWRGLRLAADMVPNHSGIDSAWVRERPELFVQSDDCPFPSYRFNGGDLSGDGRVGIWLEDHYYERSDAAVVFKRLDRSTGKVSYIYHGNDGTGLPWSDTAQIDFLKSEAREAVKERILHVARNFPIIRFDAAMILAKRHFRRLWYPEPGHGGDIPSRADRAISAQDFDAAMPEEFWREVVDLCAAQAPDTLLLAEAFWMMEGYFVRTLGMHRVYNSAFMNMLKREENSKYRDTIKNTQEFDKDILKRFVNFMNNPDEETAVAQFGRGDKYFGACTMMATMPGLPMFGHGQLEGFEEKYGMEYRRAYRDEIPDRALIERHGREIFPLLKKRHLFSGVEHFLLFDLVAFDGSVNENVFAYSNGSGSERALVLYNNAFARAEGRIRESCSFAEKLPGASKRGARRSLAEAFGLHGGGDGRGRERFAAMREQRSGLWFLRRSSELAESGLHVMLDGYQSQVFLDIFEVEDDEERLYRQVYDALGGAGTPDLSAALQDVALKELYAALAGLVGPGLLSWAEAIASAGKAPAAAKKQRAKAPAALAKAIARTVTGPAGASAAAASLPDSAPAARAFYALVRDMLRNEAAEEGLPGDPSYGSAAGRPEPQAAGKGARRRSGAAEKPPLGSANAAPSAEALAAADEAAVAAACARFEAGLAIVSAIASSPGKAPDGSTLDDPTIFEELFFPGRAKLAVCYLALDALRPLVGKSGAGEEARRLSDRLCLDRKLREALRESGMHGDEAFHGLALAKAFLSRSGAPVGSGQAKGTRRTTAVPADECVEALALAGEDEELGALLAANVFEGVTWFNKERFEEAARFAALVSALTPPWPQSPTDPQLGPRALAAGSAARRYLAAAEASGYRFDRLAELVDRPKGSDSPRNGKKEP